MATPVTAPMTGKVLKILKRPGEAIAEDEPILLLEAMKMEIPVVAPAGGTLREVMVAPGQSVESDALLAIID